MNSISRAATASAFPGLIIRADASEAMGTGHVMRCVSLAAPWVKAGRRVVLAAACLPETLAERAEGSGIELQRISAPSGSAEDASATCKLAQAGGVHIAVVDGYQFDHRYQEAMAGANVRLLWIDDFGHAAPYLSDFILNQNLGASGNLYRERAEGTRLLLGPRYALLRQQFKRWRGWRRKTADRGRRILVTLGGSDPENATAKALEAIHRLRQMKPDRVIEADVVVGGANPHFKELETRCSNASIRLLRNVADMDDLMAGTDLAVAAGGTTVWELAFMGLPALLLTLADNQAANVRELHAGGAARDLGTPTAMTPARLAEQIGYLLDAPDVRESMSHRGRALVDGLGTFRVWLELNEGEIRLREVVEGDCRRVFDWANDPLTRSASFHSEAIPWAMHQKWFAARISDPACHFWIAESADGMPLGQVRFEMEDKSGTISISLDPGARGHGLGTLLIGLGCRRFFRETSAACVRASVKPSNAASIRAFENSGFERHGETTVNGTGALCFKLDRAVLYP